MILQIIGILITLPLIIALYVIAFSLAYESYTDYKQIKAKENKPKINWIGYEDNQYDDMELK